MDNLLVFQEATRLIRTNKFAWFYICISFVSLFFPSSQENKKDFIFFCFFPLINLLLFIASTIVSAGLVYDISQKYLKHMDISIRDGWDQGKERIGRILGFFLLVSIPLILILVCVWAISRQPGASIPVFGLLVQFFLAPIFAFGICAIVIDNINIRSSIWISLRLLSNHLPRLLAFSARFILIQGVLFVLLALAIFLSPLRPELSFPPDFNYATWLSILQAPVIKLSNLVLSILLSPWETATFTIAYLILTEGTSYTELLQRASRTSTIA
jgi:hypothetical protein